jgi:SAM-dependent methyltransferase
MHDDDAAKPPAHDPTERFSDRVADYVRYRPGYPPQLITHLREQGWLPESAAVADIGAGTGISSALFLDAGCTVYAVEPNAPMRAAAKEALAARTNFIAIDGRAEATTLAAASVDLVGAGTAFHWFDPAPTRAEFARILRRNGHVALFWNLRDRDSRFMRDYETLLLAHCRGYAEADSSRRADEASVRSFFAGGLLDSATFANAQPLDFDGLVGRVQSSSYAPRRGDPAEVPMLAALRELFDRYAVDAHIELRYATRLYVGTVS